MNLFENYKLYQKGVICRGAAHTELKLTAKQKSELLKKYNAWFVRNLYDFDCPEQTSFWFVICDTPAFIESYKTNVRNQVRKSLNMLDFMQLSPKELIEKGGYHAYKVSFARYQNISENILTKEQWNDQILNNAETKEFWGAFMKESGKLIAYGDALIQDNSVKYTALKGDLNGNRNCYPFYGLLYMMNQHYLNEKQMLYVNDGARTVSEHSNIQDFLIKFNFRKAYCKIDITYVWWLKILVNMLYPFRKIIPILKVKYLLRFEAIRRGQY